MRSVNSILSMTGLAALVSAAWAFAPQARQVNPPQGKPAAQRKAQPDPQSQVAQPAPDKKDSEVWTVDGMDIEHNDATGIGSARYVTAVSQDGTIIKADEWNWKHKERYSTGSGNLTLTDPEVDGTSEKVEVFYAKSKKLLVMTGHVDLTLKPKEKKKEAAPMPVSVQGDKAQTKPNEPESDEESRRTPVQVTCDKLEYEYAKDKKHGKLTGNLRAVQKLKDTTRTLTAEWAETFGNKDEVILYPPVFGSDTKGRIFESKMHPVLLNTKDGAETIKVKVGQIKFPADDDDEKKPNPPAKNP